MNECIVEGFEFYDKVKLLPCPFCGSVNLGFNQYLSDGWVECLECESRGPCDDLAIVHREKCEGNAIDLWNDRNTGGG